MNFEIEISGSTVQISEKLVAKYDLPLPRYTSYPTAPIWNDSVCSADLKETLATWRTERPLSIYIHIPFCKTGCLFCGCHSIVTKNSQIIADYLAALKKEILSVAGALPAGCKIQEIHLGGGSPNSLNNRQMEKLFETLRSSFNIDAGAEISIEADPRTTAKDQPATWRKSGINRLSLGVQDTNPFVQQAIGRIQPREQILELAGNARSLGFSGINFDLIYGLPLQTVESFAKTIGSIVQMNPDRIALFNFAYLPGLKAHQRHLSSESLPLPSVKFSILCRSVVELQIAGYAFIGMDHFAKKNDPLAIAATAGKLNRNFQGYTTARDMQVIGLGVTGISDLDYIYLQNEKKLNRYISAANAGTFATTRGYRLSDEDRLRRRIIRDLFCNNKVVKTLLSPHFDKFFDREMIKLKTLENDGLVTLAENEIIVTPLGRLFIRNIAAIFDAHLNNAGHNMFSRSV